MPARTATAPRAVPAGRFIIRRLPHYKIHRIFFVGGNLDPRAGNHIVNRPARQRTIVFVFAHPKQHMPFIFISVTICNQIGNHRDHLADIGRCTRHRTLMITAPDRGLQRADRGHVIQKPLRGFGGDLCDGTPGLSGTRVYFVIHIREIAHIGDALCAICVTQQPIEHVKHQHRPRIAQVRAVINGGSTDIHTHIVRIDWIQHLFAAGGGVIECDIHVNARAKGWRGPSNSELSRKQRTGPLRKSAENAATNANDLVHAPLVPSNTGRGQDTSAAARVDNANAL